MGNVLVCPLVGTASTLITMHCIQFPLAHEGWSIYIYCGIYIIRNVDYYSLLHTGIIKQMDLFKYLLLYYRNIFKS